MASDRNAGGAQTLTATHTHRFGAGTELVTKLRRGAYERDQRAGTVRFAAAALQPDGLGVSLASLGPGHGDQPRHAAEDPEHGHASMRRAT